MHWPMPVAASLLIAGLFSSAIWSADAQPPSKAAIARTAYHRRRRADPVFVTNPGLANVSVYPVGSFGNVPTLVTNPNLQSPSGIARDSIGKLYVANSENDSITVYTAGANGYPNPVATISGNNTGLTYPSGIALDANSNIYVANAGTTYSITVYPAGSNGNVTPTATISGSSTGLNYPGALAVDSNKNIYVTNGDYTIGAGSVTEFSAGSNGNAAPLATIAGSNTGLITPAGIALDPAGNIYVANDDYGGGDEAGSVEVFPPGSSGNVAPASALEGSCSDLNVPQGVAIDAAGNIYVANSGGGDGYPGGIAVYAAGSDECATPMATISGTTTGLIQPTGLIVDSSQNIYVTDFYTNTVAVFSSGSNGNLAPAQTISDPPTGMNFPTGIAIDSSGKIYVTDDLAPGAGLDSVLVYPAGSNANVVPTKDINGSKTKLSTPAAIAIEPNDGLYADNGIYVANEYGGYQGNGSINVYTQGSDGNAAPYFQIAGDSTGDNTGLNDPIGVAYRQGYVYALNASGGSDYAGSITWYYPRLFGWGNIVALYTIHGSNTGLNYPSGFALDSNGRM